MGYYSRKGILSEMTDRNIFFVFACGSSGSFLKKIFEYYLADTQKILSTSRDNGNCHINSSFFNHYHDTTMIPLLKKQHPDSEIVAITFDSDDIDVITTMEYSKTFNSRSVEYYKLFESRFSVEINRSNFKDQNLIKYEIKKSGMVENLRFIENIDFSLVDFLVSFKTIMGLNDIDLHQEICNYLKVDRSATVDRFINEYRTINKEKYFK